MSDDLIVVGALLADVDGREDTGAACVYVRGLDGRFPKQPMTVLTADNPIANEGFSTTLAIAGRRILVGSSRPTDGESGLYVFEPAGEDQSRWKQVARLRGADKIAGFGSWGLAASGSSIYVGEPYSQIQGEHNGQVAVIAYEERDGRSTFRRLETIKMPE